MSAQGRPLSPHLGIYRWQITMALSILHRATGVALAAGLLLLTWWVAAAASGPGYFDMVQVVFGSWFGLLVLFGFTLALFYHLCNGIRHLVWDAGYGFENQTVIRTGQAVVVATVVLTALSWAIGLAAG